MTAARLFTIPETGERLGRASDNHVYRLIATGELRAVDISVPGSRRSKTRVREDDLADYIEKATRNAAGGALPKAPPATTHDSAQNGSHDVKRTTGT